MMPFTAIWEQDGWGTSLRSGQSWLKRLSGFDALAGDRYWPTPTAIALHQTPCKICWRPSQPVAGTQSRLAATATPAVQDRWSWRGGSDSIFHRDRISMGQE